MRLIDADALEELFREIIGHISKRPEIDGALEHMVRASAMAIEMIRDAQTITAVPLEPLCEWLEKNATMECDGCRAPIGGCEGDDGDESVCNSRERWKKMLTKWMEGLHAAD